MAKLKQRLFVYCLSGPMISTEWASILGDKYCDHLNFQPVLVDSPREAQVIAWNGVVTPKSSLIMRELLGSVSEGTVLLLTGDAQTMLEDHPFLRLCENQLDSVFLPPSKNLPEEILEALSLCREKLGHA